VSLELVEVSKRNSGPLSALYTDTSYFACDYAKLLFGSHYYYTMRKRNFSFDLPKLVSKASAPLVNRVSPG